MLTRLFVERPRLAFVVIALSLLAGALSLHSLVQQEYPNVAHPTINVSATYTGASTTVMRNAVVIPIEEQLSGSPNLLHITAIVQAGSASISAQFALASNVATDLTNVEKAVQAARANIPSVVPPPTIRATNPSQAHVVSLSISSRSLSSSALAQVAISNIVPTIEQIAGVSKVNVSGDAVPAYEVRVDPQKLAADGLTLTDIVATIAGNNVRAPGGYAYESNRQTSLDVRGDIVSPASVAALLVQSSAPIVPPAANATSTNPWTQVLQSVAIGSVATVTFSHEPQLTYAAAQGRRSILLEVRKASSQSEVTVADNVLAAIPALRRRYPEIDFKVIEVQAEVTAQQINGVQRTLLEGIALTALVMLFFLQSWRNAIVVSIAIPTSLGIALLVMNGLHLTLDTISLLAMTLVVAILIDDSTVVLENIERHHKQLGAPADRAAIEGRSEISSAAVVLTLVDVVVFLPIAFMHGQIGRELSEFGVVVTVSTLTSLFISFTVTPALAGVWALHSNWRPPAVMRAFERTFEGTRRWYAHYALSWGLRHPWAVVAVAVVTFAAAVALVPLGVVGSEFIPPQDRGEIFIQVRYPVGTPLQTTQAHLRVLERAVDKIADLRSETTVAGRYSAPFGNTVDQTNVGQIHLFLDPGRKQSTQYWVGRLQELVARDVPGSNPLVIAASGTGGGSVQPIDEIVALRDGTDPSAPARRVLAAVRATPGAANVSASATAPMPQISVRFDSRLARALDVSVGTAATAIQAAFGGAIATQFNTIKGLVYVQVIYAKDHLYDPRAIEAIPVRAINGSIVHVGDFAHLDVSPAPPLITRENRADVVHVNADVAPGYALSNVQAAIGKRVSALHLPSSVSVHPTANGQQARMQELLIGIGSSLVLSIVLVYLLMVALYDSFVSPFIIMFAVPVAAVGAIGALALFHQTLNLFSLIGTIMLVGIVTKNGILIVDYANTLRRNGAGKLRAIVKSAATRFRPIVMTTVSMIVGMLPLALALEPGSQVRQSLGIVVIGGMSSSLLLTLLLVPIMYFRFAPQNLRRRSHGERNADPSVNVRDKKTNRPAPALSRLMQGSAPLSVLALAAVLLNGCASHSVAPANPTPTPQAVRTVTATVGTINPSVTLAGLIAPRQNVALSSSLVEPALSVSVRPGDHVTQGEILAVLATDDLRASLESALRTAAADNARTSQVAYQAQSAFALSGDTVNANRAAVAQARTTLQNDELNLDRDQRLLARGYVAQQQVDTQRTLVATDEQAVRSAQATLQSGLDTVRINGSPTSGLQAANVAAARAQAQAALSQATELRRQIARAVIRSPIDGILVNRNLNPGEYPGSRQIFTLQKVVHVYAILNASSAEIAEVRRGATAKVVPAAGSRRSHVTGVVTGVLPQTTPGSTNFAVQVDVPNPTGSLLAGTPVLGTIALAPIRGVRIPTTAFLDDKHDSVMAARDGRVHRTAVSEIGSAGDLSIVSGLANHERVVANGALGLLNGSRVASAN